MRGPQPSCSAGWRAKRGHDVESATLVAEDVAPAARPGAFAAFVFAVGDRARARNRDHTGSAVHRAREGDTAVVGDDHALGAYQFVQQCGFVFRSAAHPETGGTEAGGFKVETGAAGGRREALAHDAQEFGAGFGAAT